MVNLIGPEGLLARLEAEGIVLKRPTLTKYAAMGVIPPSQPTENRRGWGWPEDQVPGIIELIRTAQRSSQQGVRLGTLACQQWARQSPQEAVTTVVSSLAP